MTGGIGSGKSTIAAMLQDTPGVFVIDSDRVAKEIVLNHRCRVARIIGVTLEEFSLALTAQIIFSDLRKKALLENYIHPLVKKRIWRMLRPRPEQIIIIESALIFERNWQEEFDLIIAAVCPPRIQIARVQKRSNWTKQKVLERMNSRSVQSFIVNTLLS